MNTPTDLQTRLKRLLYRCTHRGTKEMDWLLGRYAESLQHQWDDTEWQNFEALLDIPDQELYTAIMQGQRLFAQEQQHHIDKIRSFFSIV